METQTLDRTARIVLVFGVGLPPDCWMNAKHVVPIVGGNASAWKKVQDALEALEFAGYITRVENGGTCFYRREALGHEAAVRILNDDGLSIIAESAKAETAISAWQPDAGAPTSLAQMIGQKSVLYQVRLNVDWAKAEQRPARPMLFSGPSGYGKTMLGGLVSQELAVPWVHLSMAEAEITTVKSALALVTGGGVLFLDELHAAKPRVRDALLVELGREELPFTPIAATTNLGVLKADIVRRFRRVIEFEPYRLDEAELITIRKAAALGIELEPPVPSLIARAARAKPARIGVLVDECIMLASRHGAAPSREQFLEHLRQRGSDERGIENVDRRLLDALSKQSGGTAGLQRLAAFVQLAPEHALERLQGLAREDLVRAAARAGWTITQEGARYLSRRSK